MNPILPLAVEIVVFAAVYLLASAITWPLRRRCRDEDVLALGPGGCLRHVFGRMSRSLVVIVLTFVALDVSIRFNLPPASAEYEPHVFAWLRFWEFVLLIAPNGLSSQGAGVASNICTALSRISSGVMAAAPFCRQQVPCCLHESSCRFFTLARRLT